MTISLIVATAENGVIGSSGNMPWHMPADLAHFRKTTTGHPIVMGRVTYESIGKALPERTNIVISSEKNFTAEGCAVVDSLDKAVDVAKKAPGSDEIFIIGGASVYKQALPLVDRIYLTRIHAEIKGDKYFTYDPAEWEETASEPHQRDEKNRFAYDFVVLERRTS